MSAAAATFHGERYFCSCGMEITPQFEGDMGVLFHVLADHKIEVVGAAEPLAPEVQGGA